MQGEVRGRESAQWGAIGIRGARGSEGEQVCEERGRTRGYKKEQGRASV